MSHSHRRLLRTLFFAVTVLFASELVLAQSSAPAKRPITHADYDTWKSAQPPVVSRDGKHFAYSLLPSDGDGEFIVRNLATNVEHRVPRGRVVVGGAPGASEAKSSE